VLSPLSNVNAKAPCQPFSVPPPVGACFPSVDLPQIWIAAVDLNQLSGTGSAAIDPSYPAFRFPSQDLSERTHRPFWTADALKGQKIVISVQ
jgi:hypothetical protein